MRKYNFQKEILTCYHYVIFYFGLIEKKLALLIIPKNLMFYTILYSLIEDFWMILRLFKVVVFKVRRVIST